MIGAAMVKPGACVIDVGMNRLHDGRLAGDVNFAAVKEVAGNLGNTPTVCSKYYIHPQVVEFFKSGRLVEYLRRHDADPGDQDLLSPTEYLVLEMLAEV